MVTLTRGQLAGLVAGVALLAVLATLAASTLLARIGAPDARTRLDAQLAAYGQLVAGGDLTSPQDFTIFLARNPEFSAYWSCYQRSAVNPTMTAWVYEYVGFSINQRYYATIQASEYAQLVTAPMLRAPQNLARCGPTGP